MYSLFQAPVEQKDKYFELLALSPVSLRSKPNPTPHKSLPVYGGRGLRVNIYRHTFAAVCPSDGELIIYRLEVRSSVMIRVEHIKTATALIKKGWHEQIADCLAETFGGDQTITATHLGVEIETVRLSG
ncbi:hypothetical protein MO767_20225 [Pseudomonas sp. UYIF39]|uniref:hypothetical protein n=1 Tax=Pseudomonas sp. UYIF39 TaxID=1630747 RepID=UPI00249E9637|nr:hypothetical protein [Pseudomonas sp. UYIF39]MDI3356655.1 hypothetical protein [Pseudomonas sp. UYIF39]